MIIAIIPCRTWIGWIGLDWIGWIGWIGLDWIGLVNKNQSQKLG